MINQTVSGSQLAAACRSDEAFLSEQISPPRTITSAAASLRELNKRLDEVVGKLSGLADQIGGPRPCGGESGPGQLEQSGVVNDLHCASEAAHSRVSTINDLIGSIGRQIG